MYSFNWPAIYINNRKGHLSTRFVTLPNKHINKRIYIYIYIYNCKNYDIYMEISLNDDMER
jgi:hypothetical protein